MFEELGDSRGRAASLHQLAMIEQAQGNPAEARRLWEESIESKKNIGDLDGRASSLGMLAQLNALEGRFEEAVAQGRETVRLLEGIGSSKAASARGVLSAVEAMASGGGAGAAQSDLVETLLHMPAEEALTNVEQALRQARTDGQVGTEVMLLAVRAMKCWQTGNGKACDQALEEAGQALEAVQGAERRALEALLSQVKEQRARAARGLAEALRLHIEGIKQTQSGDNAEALESFQKSANLSRSEGDHRGVAVSLLCVAEVLLELGRRAEAREKIAEVLELAMELGDAELLEGLRTVATKASEIDRA